jgi:hypothetical protein
MATSRLTSVQSTDPFHTPKRELRFERALKKPNNQPDAEIFEKVLSTDTDNPKHQPVLVLNLKEFIIKWALKKMARKLYGISVPKNNTGVAYQNSPEW